MVECRICSPVCHMLKNLKYSSFKGIKVETDIGDNGIIMFHNHKLNVSI